MVAYRSSRAIGSSASKCPSRNLTHRLAHCWNSCTSPRRPDRTNFELLLLPDGTNSTYHFRRGRLPWSYAVTHCAAGSGSGWSGIAIRLGTVNLHVRSILLKYCVKRRTGFKSLWISGTPTYHRHAPAFMKKPVISGNGQVRHRHVRWWRSQTGCSGGS